MKLKVHILTTGGTIAQRSDARGAARPGVDPQDLFEQLDLPDVMLTSSAVLQKGSKDVVPEDWRTIAQHVAGVTAKELSGVVILHGTDTMHYTAAALAFMLEGIGVPVVLTGSMIPGGNAGSDGQANLRDAVRVASKGKFAEVCVVFSADAERRRGTIIRGTRARKVHSTAINAFESINASAIGSVEAGAITLSAPGLRPRRPNQTRLRTELDTNVVLIKVHPALTASTLARQWHGASGAVLEGTGVGHVRADLYDTIAAFGGPVVISTQAVHGGERLGLYAADRVLLDIPNVIPAGDMSSDTALVKLMWSLPQGNVRAIMHTNIAGEINECSLKERRWDVHCVGVTNV
jgi:L-asparaginase type I